ncbi:hypothetical protein [uncultured Dokdonia sp.]|uniref:hypothetical protein n=1 Tax=uncultured Dokdonia sp. TaxID=575653 RepID=UPI0026110B00|nr:hypothetical protein [uncultured Dokdonia sp.]
MEDLRKEFAELKKKVEAVEKKDTWDKVKIITGILLPLAIVYVGQTFSSSQIAAENRSNEKIAVLQTDLADKQFEYQKQISSINSKVGQVGLVANFFDALLSEDPVRKKLAIKAVLIALKEEGPELVKIVEESDNTREIKTFAKATLDTRREELVEQLFSDEKADRINAYNDIVSGWKNDAEMVKEIVAYGKSHPSNKDGVYNSLITLSQMNKKVLSPYKEEIISFSESTERNGTNTKKKALLLRSRIEE